jgi:hypothetical protein
MRTVLISVFVNRNKVVIAFITLEPRGTSPRLVDFWLASGVAGKGDVARGRAVVQNGNVSNIWMMRK